MINDKSLHLHYLNTYLSDQYLHISTDTLSVNETVTSIFLFRYTLNNIFLVVNVYTTPRESCHKKSIEF